MAAYKNSSLAFTDTSSKSGGATGIMKKFPTRISKQHLSETKLFGSKRKNIQIGKTFKKFGKGVGSKKSVGMHMPKSKGISPSLDEFDKMMSSVVGKSEKKGFSRKSFG